jgi:hypothetical protein
MLLTRRVPPMISLTWAWLRPVATPRWGLADPCLPLNYPKDVCDVAGRQGIEHRVGFPDGPGHRERGRYARAHVCIPLVKRDIRAVHPQAGQRLGARYPVAG